MVKIFGRSEMACSFGDNQTDDVFGILLTRWTTFFIHSPFICMHLSEFISFFFFFIIFA